MFGEIFTPNKPGTSSCRFQVNRTHLELDEVKFSSTRVHQSVKVLVACELRLDESTDVSLEKETNIYLNLKDVLQFQNFTFSDGGITQYVLSAC